MDCVICYLYMAPTFSKSSTIFTRREVLTEAYSPDGMPERQEELSDIHYALEPLVQGSSADNLFIYGKAGQGKTDAVQQKLNELKEFVNEEVETLNLTVAYLSCKGNDLSTSYKVSTYLHHQLTGEERLSGYSSDVVMSRLYEAMNEIGGAIIIILDEIDALGQDDQLLYALPRARAQGNVNDDVYPSVIGISNDHRWQENLSAEVESSLYDKKVIFHPYNANDLQRILYRRSAKAFHNTTLEGLPDSATNDDVDGSIIEIDNSGDRYVFKSDVINDEVIRWIAAKAAQNKGDARNAIHFLRTAGNIASENGDEVVTIDHAKDAVDRVKRNHIREVIQGMAVQGKNALVSLTILKQCGKTPARTGDVFAVYEKVTKYTDVDTLSQRQLRTHLKDLSTQGFINGHKRSGGNVGGPAWQYELEVSGDIVIDTLKEIDQFSQLDLDDPRFLTSLASNT